MAYTILGTAVSDRLGQWVRLLGLSAPIGELSSDTLVTAYNPETQDNWTINDIKNDPEWKALGNADENGETNGFSFERLDPDEPADETNFILTDVPANDYELVWKWLRSKFPLNNGAGNGSTWNFRPGVDFVLNDVGTLPDSNPDGDGNYSVLNQEPWIRVDIRENQFTDFSRWRNVYLVTDTEAAPAQVCYVEDQYTQNPKVGRTGDPSPRFTFENPPGTILLSLVAPLYVEGGDVKLTRLQR